MARSLLMRLYAEPALFESARIIGYGGIDMAEFWAKAKQLPLRQHDVLMAVDDLTRADRRAQEPVRYELNGDARRFCFGLLGLPPNHPLHVFVRHGPGGLVGDEIGRWQEDYRRRKAEEAQGLRSTDRPYSSRPVDSVKGRGVRFPRNAPVHGGESWPRLRTTRRPICRSASTSAS